MTEIESAAHKLMRFFRANTMPADAPEGQDDEWPISICVDDEIVAAELGSLMMTLEEELEAAGHKVRVRPKRVR